MPWLIAFLVAHAVQIAAIGATAYAIAQTEQVVVNTAAIVKEVKQNEEKK